MTTIWRQWNLAFFRKKRFLIPLGILLVYHLIFNRFTGQLLLDRVTPSLGSDSASFHFRVRQFSLFYGLSFQDVRLGWKDSSRVPLFQASQVDLLWDIPAVFLGRLKLESIALVNPRIHLSIRDGIRNWDEILKEGSPSEDLPEEEEPEPLDSISTFIPVSILTKIHIQDLSIEFLDMDTDTILRTKNWDLEFILDTYRFRTIPLSLDAIYLIDELRIRLNPSRKVFLAYSNPLLESENEFDLRLEFEKKNSGKDLSILSSANIGGNNLGFRPVRQMPVQFSSNIDWDFSWIPGMDTMLLNSLKLEFQGKHWLVARGSLDKPKENTRRYDFQITQSEIILSDLNTLITKIPGVDFGVGGELNLSPLSIQGESSDLSLDWKVTGKNLRFTPNKGQSHTSRFIAIDLRAEVDLDSNQSPSPENPIPILKSLNLNQARAEYNGLIANLKGNYSSEKHLDLSIQLERFGIGQFVSNLSGLLDASLIVRGENLKSLSLKGGLDLKGFRFSMDRSLSGYSNHKADFDLGIEFIEGFELSSLVLHSLNMKSTNHQGRTAFSSRLGLDLGFLGEKTLNLKQFLVSANLTNTLSILPLSLRQNVLTLENISPEIQLNLHGSLGLDSGNYRLGIEGKLPGIDLADLRGNIHIQESKIGKDDWNLKELRLTGFNGILNLNSNGRLYKKPGDSKSPLGGFFGNLNLNASLKSPLPQQITQSLNYRGNMEFRSKINDNLIEGEFILENVRTLFQKGTCPGSSCKIYLVENLNADIPISHDLNRSSSQSLIEGDKSRFIKTYGRIPRDNISIQNIFGTHPSIPGAPFAYVKGSGNYPGLTGRIRYKENYLHIDGLKLSLLDGIVYGKDILLNVGNGNPKSMEYMGSIQVRDIDLKQLMSSSAQKVVDDGKIKADLNLSGTNLLEPISELKLYFSIFQIGRDFGKSVLNILSTKGILMNYITDSYAIDKVEVELSKGLVYADVLFKRSLLSMVVNLEDSKITQSRMPLANFLQRAENEIATYR